ncbi:hypothetical protein FRX31_004840, partial [Thalictrum thalictroides]
IDTEKTFQLDLNEPVGYVCHNCEMYAIVGMRYRCKDCWEKYDSPIYELEEDFWFDVEDTLMLEGDAPEGTERGLPSWILMYLLDMFVITVRCMQ